MRAAWSASAGTDLESLFEDLREQIEAEVRISFMDAVPGDALRVGDGTLFIELPCGVEIYFETIGDGVRILQVTDQRA